jgi:hypothetical protein
MYIVDISFENILYFLEKGNISVHTAFQGNNNQEKCRVEGYRVEDTG